MSRCSSGERRVQCRLPKRRGSVSRNASLLKTMSTWSCFSTGVVALTRRRLPDMPRCRMAVPVSACSNRYFARLATLLMVCPVSSFPSRAVTGQRRFGLRTITRVTCLPVMWGAIPRQVVSTSGSSGMWFRFRAALRYGEQGFSGRCLQVILDAKIRSREHEVRRVRHYR